MKILEVKNDLVKISYTAQDDLTISGFVVIEDSQNPYVAQVMSLKAGGGMNYAIVKLLFTFNEEGVVKNYNGSIPELSANVTKLSADELLDILPIENPLKLGKLAQQKFILNVDYSTLEKNLLVCSDNLENTDILVSNLAKQLNNNNDKSIIFDTTGTINAENKLVLGKDIKLPLNYDTINFIYEHDLNDVDATSKAVLQDILLEVQEYSKTVLDRFIPFDSFINVVDAQYRQLKLPELALLKNRLMKYKEENIFAQEAKDIHMFRGSVRANLSTLVDISEVDSILQNLALNALYNELCDLDLFVYSFVKIDNDNADKRLIKKFITQDKIYTTVICSHNFKYLYDLKEVAGNMILFTPQTTQHDFSSYNVFLNKLNSDEYIIYGKSTQNIPLIIENLPLEDLEEYENEFNTVSESEQEEPIQEETEENSEVKEEENSFDESSDSYSQESMIEDEPIKDEFDEDIPQAEEPAAAGEELEPLAEYNEEENEQPVPQQKNLYDESSLEPIEESEDEEYLDLSEKETEVEEETPSEVEEEVENAADAEEQLNDIDEFSSTSELVEAPEEVISEYSEDIVEAEAPVIEDNNDEPYVDDVKENLTEDDLNFIDDVNGVNSETTSTEEETLPEAESESYTESEEEDNGEFEPIQETFVEGTPAEEETPPVVPIYPVEEETPVSGVQQDFEAGDRVTHPKYGEGIVEKMVKFGNKVLCAISFANGRRLLDPTISQIEKI